MIERTFACQDCKDAIHDDHYWHATGPGDSTCIYDYSQATGWFVCDYMDSFGLEFNLKMGRITDVVIGPFCKSCWEKRSS